VKKTVVNDDGTESPAGSSLDGNKVILGDSSDEECPCHPEPAETLAATVAARKVEAEAVAVTEAMAALKVSKKEKELRAAAKEAAKAVKEAEKKEKDVAKAVKEAAKALAKSEKELAKAEKPKKEKSESPKPRGKAKAKAEPAKAELAAEDSDEDEEIVIDGEDYILRGVNVFDDEGTLRGKKVNGKIEWDDEVTAGKKHMNR
jgi:hypothetical protein